MSRDLILSHGLTPTQNALVNEYLSNGFNKSAAAKKLGHSVQIFNEVKVERCLADLRRELMAESNAKAVAVIDKLCKMAMVDLGEYIEPTGGGNYRVKADIPPEMMFAVSELKTDKDGITTIKLYKPHESIEQLSKILGWYKEQAVTNLVINGDNANVVVDENSLKRDLAFQLSKYFKNNESVVIDVIANEVEDDCPEYDQNN